MKSTQAKLGIICAMPQEIALLEQDILSQAEHTVAGRSFYEGTLYGREVILVRSNIGKVATAITTTLLIERFGVGQVLFSGTAGGIDPEVSIGDIVVADCCVQHDFDADSTPTFRIPIIEQSYFKTDPDLTGRLCRAAERYLNSTLSKELDASHLSALGITAPKIHQGTIASGDQFISSKVKNQWLYEHVNNLKCAEMEGAAMAQVCYEYQIPYAVMRVVSDAANDEAPVSFDSFVEQAAQYFTRGTLREMLQESL